MLAIPYFFIHPCNTANLMSSLLHLPLNQKRVEEEKINYIVSWLSVVGPIVHLLLPLTIFQDKVAYDPILQNK